ncbi:hypothetical protein F2Q70_00016391 [Brassica cretica]|uniref:Uncharacterized protein n=1 Tax=Brassica cretica TaxID=69181 RepID=A0A8S9HUW5_BRACR|nr:hypothetical protein F2Q70_00016391 [Brassica cretica]KAF2596314.1 hypothetical protein F2Q68_00009357 [Brassica cretica]
MVILEPFETFELAFQCHRFEVNQHPVEDVIPGLLKRSQSAFTEEWSVCLARGSCRGDEGLSIDETTLVSIDSDARIWAEHIL